jgi:hypothetical protein
LQRKSRAVASVGIFKVEAHGYELKPASFIVIVEIFICVRDKIEKSIPYKRP